MDNKTLRYWGEFRSKGGTLWRVELFQQAPYDKKPGDTPWPVSRMTFPYENPLEIEWSKTDKIEPLQPSNATLTLVSETDRQYIDLYALEPRSVILKVFRNYTHTEQVSGDPAPQEYLYWSGSLDTELYEEPYSEKDDYEVSLTFSDLAILDRLKWTDTTAILSMDTILEKCIAATGVSVMTITEDKIQKQITKKYISTKVPDTKDPLVFNDLNTNELFLQTANFFDEDGEPMSLQEVLEGVLQAFALKLIQKEGRFILYDLNAVYELAELASKEVVWAGTNAMLNTDKVYNNVNVTFSPYIAKELLAPEIEVDEIKDKFTLDPIFLNYVDRGSGDGGGEHLASFNFYYGTKGTGVDAPYFCKFSPLYSGTEATGILYFYRAGKASSWHDNGNLKYMPDGFVPNYGMNDFTDQYTEKVFSLPPVYLPVQKEVNPQKELVVTVDLLCDSRYNPFENASSTNEDGNFDYVKENFNFVYLPAKLVLRAQNGKITHYYSNINNVKNGYTGVLKGEWKTGDPGNKSVFFLAYYDPGNIGHGAGVQGWKKNRQAIGASTPSLPRIYAKMGEGEYIPLPPAAGHLEFSVYPGAVVRDEKKEHTADIYRLRWFCYKSPKILISNPDGTSIKEEDINDFAWLNKAATENLDLETIVGTLRNDDYACTARGTILDKNGQVIPLFIRADRKVRLEELLINTAFSQYASRHNILSGTVELLPEFSLLSERSSEGKHILISEVQNLMEDESNIKMTQLSPEIYFRYEE